MRIQSTIPAVGTVALPSFGRALRRAVVTLGTWRARSRERAELATMDARDRRDLPFAREFDVRREIAKPFWRE
jgi:uncharacterized protein YjiS (DUF1127 family)